MKWIEADAVLEVSQRNVAALAAKLDDELSARSIVAPGGHVMVRAVEDTARTAAAASAAVSEGVVPVTRSELQQLSTVGATVTVAGVTVVAVTDAEHYGDRAPGEVYMPTREVVTPLLIQDGHFLEDFARGETSRPRWTSC